MTRPRHALIIGGGIAGPTVAMALQRAGIASTIYEAYPTGADAAGVFLTVAVNGLDALRTLDLHRVVMDAGFPTGSIEFFSGTGRRLGEIPIGGTLPDATVTHTIKRADLYRGGESLPVLDGNAPTARFLIQHAVQIGRASCRERV